MERKAEVARTDEMRRSYLILARDWHEMADKLLGNAAWRQFQEKGPPERAKVE